MNNLYYLFPVVAALAGMILHSIYVYFLFHPSNGILNKKKNKIAKSIGSFAAREFNLLSNIDEKINDPKHFEKIKPFVENHVDDFLRVRLGKEMPMISMFIGDKTIDSLKKIFMQELENLFPQVIGQLAGNFKAEMDVEKLVSNRISGMHEGQLETIMKNTLKTEIRSFKLIGAVTGFVIGVLLLVFTLILT